MGPQFSSIVRILADDLVANYRQTPLPEKQVFLLLVFGRWPIIQSTGFEMGSSVCLDALFFLRSILHNRSLCPLILGIEPVYLYHGNGLGGINRDTLCVEQGLRHGRHKYPFRPSADLSSNLCSGLHFEKHTLQSRPLRSWRSLPFHLPRQTVLPLWHLYKIQATSILHEEEVFDLIVEVKCGLQELFLCA